MPRPSHLLNFITRMIFGKKLLVIERSPLPWYVVTLIPRSPQHPVLEHPQPVFFPHYKRTCFIPMQNTGKIIVVYILDSFTVHRRLRDVKVI
jgi:hypothetical protein